MTTVKEYEAMSDEDKEKFWGDVDETTSSRLTGWAGQMKVPLSELRDRFNEKVAALAIQLEGENLSIDLIRGKARSLIANDIRPGRSKAGTYEGVILGWGPLKDWNDFWFNVAKSAFNKDPLQSRMDGLVDDHGNALVTNEIKDKKGQYFNQEVGALLAHEWERSVLAIGRSVVRPEGDETMRIFHIKLTGEPARFADPAKFPAPKMGLICRWRCNVQEVNKELNWIRAHGATVTAFTPATVQTKGGPMGGFNEDGSPKLYDAKRCAGLVQQAKPEFTSTIQGLKEWVDNYSKEKGRFVVVKGEIIAMYARAMRIGNSDQLDLEDIPTLHVKLDAAVPDQMFYGESSSVVVACHPYEQTARKQDDGKWVDDLDEDGNKKKEIVADGIAVFPTIAMPKSAPAVPAAPAVPEVTAEAETESEKEAPSTIEL